MTAPDHRLQWSDIPDDLRVEVARALDSHVVEAIGQRGGYGPSLAARCRLANGRRVFIKAVSSAQNPDSPHMMRREAEVAALLPAGVPAPALLHAIDSDDWVLLAFEDVEGTLPAAPWRAAELQRVLDAMRELSALAAPEQLPTIAQHYGPMFVGWRTLAREGPESVGDPWCRARLDELAAAESRWEAVAVGDRLVHGDVRSDNVLLTPDGRVMFVDWTATCIGPAWFDVMGMLPVVQLEGGGEPEAVLEQAGWSELGTDVLVPFVSAMAGYFAERGRLPDPPGLPTLRPFQRAQGAVTLAWLQRLWHRD
jgi:hypothetical protein